MNKDFYTNAIICAYHLGHTRRGIEYLDKFCQFFEHSNTTFSIALIIFSQIKNFEQVENIINRSSQKCSMYPNYFNILKKNVAKSDPELLKSIKVLYN